MTSGTADAYSSQSDFRRLSLRGAGGGRGRARKHQTASAGRVKGRLNEKRPGERDLRAAFSSSDYGYGPGTTEYWMLSSVRPTKTPEAIPLNA